jgi:hypothetical protein
MDNKAAVALVALGGLALLAMAGAGGASPQAAPSTPYEPPRPTPRPPSRRPGKPAVRDDAEDAGEVVDRGWEMINEPSSPFRAFVDGKQNQDCSVMTAVWLLAMNGQIPEKGKRTDFNAWYAMDPALWKAVNTWDASEPWSSVIHMQKLLEHDERIRRYPDATRENPPVLENWRWHLVQRWRDPNDTSKGGHAFLVWNGPDGNIVKVHSSADKGFRFDTVTTLGGENRWFREGDHLAILPLPSTLARASV